MNNYFALALGVFIGNFFFHAVSGDYIKGIAIGSIAAILVLIIGAVIKS